MVLGSRAGLVWFYLFISINDGAPLCRLFFFPVAGRESWKEAGLSLSLGQASERSSVSSLELVWNLCFFPPPPQEGEGWKGKTQARREATLVSACFPSDRFSLPDGEDEQKCPLRMG